MSHLNSMSTIIGNKQEYLTSCLLPLLLMQLSQCSDGNVAIATPSHSAWKYESVAVAMQPLKHYESCITKNVKKQ
jgi:hypothetical protein